MLIFGRKTNQRVCELSSLQLKSQLAVFKLCVGFLLRVLHICSYDKVIEYRQLLVSLVRLY